MKPVEVWWVMEHPLDTVSVSTGARVEGKVPKHGFIGA